MGMDNTNFLTLSTDLQHGQVLQREITEASDVEEADFIGALLKVALGKSHRPSQISHITARAGAALPYIVLITCVSRGADAHLQGCRLCFAGFLLCQRVCLNEECRPLVTTRSPASLLRTSRATTTRLASCAEFPSDKAQRHSPK